MKTAVLLAVYFLFSGCSSVCVKLCSRAAEESGSCGKPVFFLINSLSACLFFWIGSGFKLRLNPVTLGYCAVFAAVVLASLLVSLYIYRFYKVAEVTVLSSAGSLILGAVIGRLLFGEVLTAVDGVRSVLMLAAVAFVFFGFEGEKKAAGKPAGFLGMALLLANVGIGGASVTVQKLFAVDPRVTDENSFFFFTNAVMLLVVIPWLILSIRRTGSVLRGIRQALGAFRIAYMGNTLCSNVLSWITVALLQTTAVSVYVPVTTAMGILAGVFCSFLFREKVNGWMWAAALSSVAAVIL